MGQALIDSGGKNGLYDITIVKDAGRSSSDLAQINARLVTLTVEISTAQATLGRNIRAGSGTGGLKCGNR